MSDPEKPDPKTVSFADLQKYPPSENDCRCGAFWMSRARFVGPPFLCMVAEVPCPACGERAKILRSRSQPERFTLGREDAQ